MPMPQPVPLTGSRPRSESPRMLKPFIITFLTCIFALEPVSAEITTVRAMKTDTSDAAAQYEKGKALALSELEKTGQLNLERYTVPDKNARRLSTLMKRKYGILNSSKDLPVFPGRPKGSALRGYNDAMLDAIIQKFGRNVFAEEKALFDSEQSGPLHEKGEKDALRDLATGKLQLFFPSLGIWDMETRKILKEERGVRSLDLEWMDDHGFQAYSHGYNSVMEGALGKTFLAEVQQKAIPTGTRNSGQ